MLENHYVQRHSSAEMVVSGVSRRIEHTSVQKNINWEAKESKGELSVIWRDLANAYGTVTQKLVETTQKIF